MTNTVIEMPPFKMPEGTKIDPESVESLVPLCEASADWEIVPKTSLPPASTLYEREVHMTQADITRSARIAKLAADPRPVVTNVDRNISREEFDKGLETISITSLEFENAVKRCKELELKLAIVILISQIARDYRRVAKEWGLLAKDAKFHEQGEMRRMQDTVVEDFSYQDLAPGDCEIHFRVWTRRVLFTAKRREE